ncbi:MAG: polysaccharide deacetylase family protein [Pseudobdellovibrionaceae bacterium]
MSSLIFAENKQGTSIAATPLPAKMATFTSPRSRGIVSFTFDDGDYSAIGKAYPLFKKYKLPATAYIPTQYVGQLWQPNINDYNMNERTKYNRYMNWSELHTLELAGWEIGDHSATHPNFEEIDPTLVMKELSESKQTLLAHGFKGQSFATPFGSYHVSDLTRAAKLFRSHRGFWEREGLNTIEDRNNLLLHLKAVMRSTSVKDVESWIDEAVNKGQWLVLVFHIIDDTPGTSNEFTFTYPTADLEKILQKTKSLSDKNKIDVMTVEKAAAPRGNTIFKDSMSEASLENWNISPLSQLPVVHIDNSFHGAFPEPMASMAIEGSQQSFSITSKPVKINVKSSSLEVELYLEKMQFKAESVKLVLVQNMSDGRTRRTLLKELSPQDLPVQRLILQTPQLSSETENVQLEIQVPGPSHGTFYLDEIRIGEL